MCERRGSYMRFERKIVADSACTWCIMDRQLHFIRRNTDPNATNQPPPTIVFIQWKPRGRI